MIEHVRPRANDRFSGTVLAEKIRCQHLDGRVATAHPNGSNNGGKMRGSAIGKVVPIN